MPTRVYDFRTDVANVVVFPEIRARFSRMEPGPAGPLHSHDIAGEIFVVLDGRCEFVFENAADNVTCDPGQLIYVEPQIKHTLHAVGDAPCTVYLSVTPHVEPTHTRWNEALVEQPPRYGTWRGQAPDPHAGTSTADLAQRYAAAARTLADLAQTHADQMARHAASLSEPGDTAAMAKQTMGNAWLTLRDVLWQVREAELAWNALAPRAPSRPAARSRPGRGAAPSPTRLTRR